MEIEDKTRRLLGEIGFMAGGYGLVDEADTIFGGLRALRPDSEHPIIGLSMTQLSRGEAEAARQLLQGEALKISPDSNDAKCFLGLALKLAGRASECERVLKEVLASYPSDENKAMAEGLLSGS